MDIEWVALGMNEVAWIALAFVLGLGARFVGLPPLVGFLVAGFLLNAQGAGHPEAIEKLAELGITLLLFTVGLKLNLRTLARPQVWAVSMLHMVIVIAVLGVMFYALALAGAPMFAGMSAESAVLVAFALSFSSTVFVVKVLEDRGGMTSLHGRIAIGILLMQDVAAVIFLAASTGKLPSIWALGLLGLIPLQRVLHYLLPRMGHGELLVLFGFLLALGGAEAFELVGLKGDLGALVLGVMVASHPKSEEMAKAMLGFKDLFLLGFFLSVGLSGELSTATMVAGALVAPLVLFKAALFFLALTRFRLRARTSLLTTANLSNYSEFGLIVVAIGVDQGWLGSEWLTVIAVALSLSFVIAAALSKFSESLYTRHRKFWRRLQRTNLIADDQPLDVGGATIAVIGMGGIGTGAYDAMREEYGETVVGVDIDPLTTANQRSSGRVVFLGDPADADFWDRVQASHTLKLAMLALPNHATNMAVLERLKESAFSGQVAVTARFQDEVEALLEAGATTVFNMYSEAGMGFVAHVEHELDVR